MARSKALNVIVNTIAPVTSQIHVAVPLRKNPLQLLQDESEEIPDTSTLTATFNVLSI